MQHGMYGIYNDCRCIMKLTVAHSDTHARSRRKRCGPCVLMAPEFEAAAKQLEGKVRFVKMDTDKEEAMAARLNIMGLPTLLFLDEFKPQEGDDSPPAAKAVLKGRLEGAIRKERILELCEQYFFDAPTPL